MSTPVTTHPRRASGIALLPVPHPTSSTRVPGGKGETVNKELGSARDGAGDLTEVSRHPGRAHRGFNLTDRGN